VIPDDRRRFVRQVLLAWLALTALTVVPYIVVYFWMDAPDWAPTFFVPMFLVYWPAWALAYLFANAFGPTDFPLFEFGGFVLVENLLIAVAFVALRRLLNRRRKALRDSAVSAIRLLPNNGIEQNARR